MSNQRAGLPYRDLATGGIQGVCVPGAIAKCRCGATLKVTLDVQMHNCWPEITNRMARLDDSESIAPNDRGDGGISLRQT